MSIWTPDPPRDEDDEWPDLEPGSIDLEPEIGLDTDVDGV